MRLKDKVALITGAGSGIGRESALKFSAEGARIIVVDVNDKAGLETLSLVEQSGGEAIFCHADVSKSSDAEAMVAAAEDRFGKLDVLFNNAGISHADDDDAIHTEESVWDLTFAINVRGVFLGCRYGIPALQRAGDLNTVDAGQPHSDRRSYSETLGRLHRFRLGRFHASTINRSRPTKGKC